MLKITLKNKDIFSGAEEVPIGGDKGKRVTLAYGLNGTGKTTLSTFLYRKFVKGEDVSEGIYAECKADGFDRKRVLVFNREFVEDNFVGIDRKQPGIFSLSEEDKGVLEEIENLKIKEKKHSEALAENLQAQKEHNDHFSRLLRDLEAHAWDLFKPRMHPEFSDFLSGVKGAKKKLVEMLEDESMPSLPPDYSGDDLKRELEVLLTGRKLSERIPLAFGAINKIEAHPIWNDSIKGKDDSPYVDIIDKLENTDWVKQGVDKYLTEGVEGQQCPFCQQDMAHQIVKGLKDHFDEEYDWKVAVLEELISAYEVEKEFINQYLVHGQRYLNNESLKKEAMEFDDVLYAILNLMEGNLKKMKSKSHAPSVMVSVFSTKDVQKEHQETAVSLNFSIEQFNKKIEDADNEAIKVGAKLWALMKWQYEDDPFINQCRKNLRSAKKQIASSEKQGSALRGEVAEMRRNISALEKGRQGIAKSADVINEGLRNLGIFNFEMVEAEDDFYAIRRIPGGESEGTYASLSEGEKTIICFLYFMELCRGKGSAEEAFAQEQVVVIDDPISSLSHQFALNVSQMIVGYVGTGKADNKRVKALILTHNLYFFHELKRSFAPTKEAVAKRIVMRRFAKKGESDNNRLIHVCPMKDGDIVSEYQSYWATIWDKDHRACIANAMRCILECFFGFVSNLNSLEDVLSDIKKDGGAQTHAFVRYMQKGSHLDAEVVDIHAEMDIKQWEKKFKDVFVKSGYGEHYRKMEQKYKKDSSASGRYAPGG